MLNNFFFENCAIYEIMWKSIVGPDRPQMIIWHVRIACWITKATNCYRSFRFKFWNVSAIQVQTLNRLPRDKFLLAVNNITGQNKIMWGPLKAFKSLRLGRISLNCQVGRMWRFSDRPSWYRIFSNYQLNAKFLYSMLPYNPQHVSSSTMLIFRTRICFQIFVAEKREEQIHANLAVLRVC